MYSANPIITSGPRSQSMSSIKSNGMSAHAVSSRRVALAGSFNTAVNSVLSSLRLPNAAALPQLQTTTLINKVWRRCTKYYSSTRMSIPRFTLAMSHNKAHCVFAVVRDHGKAVFKEFHNSPESPIAALSFGPQSSRTRCLACFAQSYYIVRNYGQKT